MSAEDLESQPTQVTPPGAFGHLPLGTVVGGRYRLVEILGTGGMGVVYRAYDEMLDLELALKVLRPEIAGDFDFLKRFRNELVLARRVSHRHVVSNYDVQEHQGLHFMTMDLVNGPSLESLLKERQSLPTDQAVRIVRQVAGALGEAHRQGIVHRDLKPANILIDEAGDAYVSDFGIARSLEGAGLTRTGEIVGTPHYLSPEQARGEKVDERSDIFTLGIIFMQLLSGKLPSPGGTLLEIVSQRMTGKLRSLDELGIEAPPGLTAIIERCVARDPAQRYQRAEDLAADLESWQSPGGLQRHGSRRSPLLWATATVFAVGLIVAVAFTTGRRLTREAPGTDPAAASTAADSTATDTTAVPAVFVAPRHAIAVLPFPEVSGSQRLAWAANGVAEILATGLAESESLRVVDSVRVFQTLDDLGFTAARLDEAERRQLGELFGVDRLVFGLLRSVADEIELEMHLMELDKPGAPSRQIDLERGAARELFQIVDQLAATLNGILEVDAAAEAAPSWTPSPEAMESYTAGLAALSRRETLAAAPALERAVAADPSFTAAWVRLSQAYQSLGQMGEALEAARQAVAAAGGAGGRIGFEARAQEALLRGEPQAAQGYLEELLGRYPNDSEAHIALGEAYASQGRFEDAIARLERAVQLDPSTARGWYLLGQYAIRGGDSRRAVDEFLPRALELQVRLGNEQGQGEVLNALGAGHHQLGSMREAMESYRRASEIRRRIEDFRGLSATLQNIARVEAELGRFEAAEERLLESLAIEEQLDDQEGIAWVHNFRGVLAEGRGRYSEALDHYRQALRIRDGLGDEFLVAETRNNVGYVYFVLGEYDNAMLHLEESLELYRRNQDEGSIILTLQSIGACQLAQGAWREASRTFLETLEKARAVEWKVAVAVSRGNLGRVAQLQGRYGAALDAYRDALELFSELGQEDGEVEFLLQEADLVLELGATDRAAARLEDVGRRQAESDTWDDRALWLTLRSASRRASGDPAAARSLAVEALGEVERTGKPADRIAARIGLGLAALALGETGTAQAELETASVEATRLGHARLRLESAEARARALLEAGEAEAAERVLREGLRRVEEVGAYARSFRLHQLLAAALASRDAAGEAKALVEARSELERVRRELDDELRRGFDRLPEVASLVSGAGL